MKVTGPLFKWFGRRFGLLSAISTVFPAPHLKEYPAEPAKGSAMTLNCGAG